MRVTRKKLGLRQAEAGALFGGGASAFSEYERGKTQPHKSTVKLLKLLDRHPELLAEVDGSVAEQCVDLNAVCARWTLIKQARAPPSSCRSRSSGVCEGGLI